MAPCRRYPPLSEGAQAIAYWPSTHSAWKTARHAIKSRSLSLLTERKKQVEDDDEETHFGGLGGGDFWNASGIGSCPSLRAIGLANQRCKMQWPSKEIQKVTLQVIDQPFCPRTGLSLRPLSLVQVQDLWCLSF